MRRLRDRWESCGSSPVSCELFTAEHAETMEAAVISLLLLLLQNLLLWKENSQTSQTAEELNLLLEIWKSLWTLT